RAHGPRVAVVLGSGLGAVPHRFTEVTSIPFADVPGLAAVSVQGHSGALALGQCAGVPLLVFRGRLHLYEGHPWDQIGMSVRHASDWGVRTLILTNAAGGIHDRLNPGDLMVLRGQLRLQTPEGVVSLISKLSQKPSRPEPLLEPRVWPAPYSPRLINLLQSA